MRTTTVLVTLLCLTGIIFIRGSVISRNTDPISMRPANFEYPMAVKAIIDKKCYGCHSVQGKSDKAKKSLMWDSIPNFSKPKLVAKLDDIIDVLDQGAMPPKEVVEKYPNAKLLPEESEMLKKWAEAAADSLMK